MFKRLLKRIRSTIEYRRFRREQNLRATTVAYNLVITGALRKHA